MGISPFKSCSSSPYAAPNVNPDPKVFEVIDRWFMLCHTILLVKYPGCNTFEGKKVLVLEGKVLPRTLTKLDPHFAESGENVPIARFPGNEIGIEHATIFVQALQTEYLRKGILT